MSLPAPICTERLVLRPLEIEDAAAVLRFRGDPIATQYLSHGPLSPEENFARLLQLVDAAESSGANWFNFGWAVELRETGEVIGDGRTWNSAEPPAPGKIPSDSGSLGYVLHPTHHGRGLGREAAGALVGWLFEQRGTQTVFAGVFEPNLPSRRLLAGLGFGQDHLSLPRRTLRARTFRPGATDWTGPKIRPDSGPPPSRALRGPDSIPAASAAHARRLSPDLDIVPMCSSLSRSGGHVQRNGSRVVWHSVTIQQAGSRGDKLG
ncbi:GNAT family N-acetyltransferase [Arthrobacter sp. PsM3]|uniref:GNAT family N-acetyltransferase n=1 Tax=Arthrobacter sp. PsM3 TaxID=3030531 RepID=UPI00345FD68C